MSKPDIGPDMAPDRGRNRPYRPFPAFIAFRPEGFKVI